MSSAPQLLSRPARFYAAARRAAADDGVRLAYFLLIAVTAMWPTLATANLLNDFRDAHYFTLFEEAARLSVLRFHQLPLWDPYYCGGISGLGTPSSRFASPTFLLTLVFGTLRADALIAILMTVVGLEGTFRYVRARGGGSLAAMTAAPVFALSGVYAHTAALGWTNFYGFELVPWALYGIRLAVGGSRRGVVVAALAVGWMIGFGGTYTGPLTALAGAFEVFSILAQEANKPRRVAHGVLMALLVALLAAALSVVRLWPVAETLAASPRIIGGTGGLNPTDLAHALFGNLDHQFKRADFLIGLPIAPLLLVGIFRKKSLPLAIGVGLWVWLALGYKVHTSLFALLRGVPPYTMLRAPERFLVFVALAAAALIALGVRRFEAGARRKPGFLFAAVLCQLLLIGNTVLLIQNAHAEAHGRSMVPAPPVMARDFHQARGNRWIAAYYPFMSRGTLSCFDDYNVAQSPELRGDLEHEEYLADPDAGTLTETRWSPGRIDLHADLTRPSRVYVNQNWHPGWRSNVGAVVEDAGQLAIDLPQGTANVSIVFQPRSAVGGIGTLILGLVAVGLVWRRSEQGDSVKGGLDWMGTAAICASPFIITALSFILIPEPPRPPPALVTPSGEPMIVDAPPEGSLPVNARWEGVTLQAINLNVDSSGDGTTVLVELDWRVTRKLPPGLGVFIRFEKPKDRFNADYVLLSDTLPIEDAPLGKTIRDVADVITLPKGKAEGTWNVYAGLWRARRDGVRLRVLGGAKGAVADNRVLVASFTVEARPE